MFNFAILHFPGEDVIEVDPPHTTTTSPVTTTMVTTTTPQLSE